jgi:hypothetical protein
MAGRGRAKGGERALKQDYDEDEDMEFTMSKEIEVYPDFESMGLKKELLRGIYDYGAPCHVVGGRLLRVLCQGPA